MRVQTVLLFLCLSTTLVAAAADSKPPVITAAAGGERVRFTSPAPTAQIRVQILLPNGDALFDSAWKDGDVLDWPSGSLANGTYRCVVMVKDLEGNVATKEWALTAQDGKVSIEDRAGAEPKVTLLAHDGSNGEIVSTSGDLRFSFGDFLAGKEKERMRLTAEGDLQVEGTIRASKGVMLPDGTVVATAEALAAHSPQLHANAPFGSLSSASTTRLMPQPTVSPDNQFKVDSAGVHIGTTTAFGLDVAGNVNLSNNLAVLGSVSAGGNVTMADSSYPNQALLWFSKKGAFRAGAVCCGQWNDPSVGSFSAAMGLSTTASGVAATAMGYSNIASGYYATTMGYATTASGLNSIAMGDTTSATATDSIAMGLLTTASGAYSTALGSFASTNGLEGGFVYGDKSTSTVLSATAPNQFLVRASGGTTFYSNSAMTTGVTLAANGASWASVSDRERKTDFQPVNQLDILSKLVALPVTSWRYKGDETRRRYIGPTAQDFHALFGLGTDTTIATLDMDGVTLAGIQALERRTAELKIESSVLRDQVERLMLNEVQKLHRMIEEQQDTIDALTRRIEALESPRGRD